MYGNGLKQIIYGYINRVATKPQPVNLPGIMLNLEKLGL
jgi:hypothetical protein